MRVASMNKSNFYALNYILVCASCLAILSGCNQRPSWQADVYPTSGVIKVNGQGAENAIVLLHFRGTTPDKRESIPWGLVNSEGAYSITTYNRGDGAPLGEYAVTLYWPSNPKEPSSPDRLKGVFLDPERPLNTVTITKGKNVIPPVDLTGVAFLPKAQ